MVRGYRSEHQEDERFQMGKETEKQMVWKKDVTRERISGETCTQRRKELMK